MNYKFGTKSLENISTCHPIIREIMMEAIKTAPVDFSVIQGYRGYAEQTKYFNEGKSKLPYPYSKHNSTRAGEPESRAIDLAPYINKKSSFEKEHCVFLAGHIMSTAKRLNYTLRWGGDWDMDTEVITDQSFQDLVHFELVLPRVTIIDKKAS